MNLRRDAARKIRIQISKMYRHNYDKLHITFVHRPLVNKNKKDVAKSNLSSDELFGLKWLKEKSTKGKLSVVQADKGGAILIVTPELLQKKVLEKLENPRLYTKLDEDPLNKLKKELFEIWKEGKVNKYVSYANAVKQLSAFCFTEL